MVTPDELAFFESLGQHLLSLYRALNMLYGESVRGSQPGWVAEYLDQGKPVSLVAYSRMKRFRDHLPGIIGPDIIPTDHGMIITELDSVPGGMGLTGGLSCLCRLGLRCGRTLTACRRGQRHRRRVCGVGPHSVGRANGLSRHGRLGRGERTIARKCSG